MGTLNIVEYDSLPIDGNGTILPVNPDRKLASKTYTSTTSSQAADVVDTETNFQRVAVLEDHYVDVGEVVDTNSRLIPAGSIEFFGRGRIYFRSVA